MLYFIISHATAGHVITPLLMSCIFLTLTQSLLCHDRLMGRGAWLCCLETEL